MRFGSHSSTPMYVNPVAWYRRTADAFTENVRVEPGVTPEDVSRTVAKQAKKVISKGHSAAIWYDGHLLAALEKQNGVLFVRVVPSMRDFLALPWRDYA